MIYVFFSCETVYKLTTKEEGFHIISDRLRAAKMGNIPVIVFLIMIETIVLSAKPSDIVSYAVPIPRSMSQDEFSQSIINYWTPERRALAQSKDEIVSKISFRRRRNAESTNDTLYFTPSVAPSITNDTEKLVRSTGTFTALPTVGKVFFTVNNDHFLCSASTISSTNGDSVITAGHCVYDTSSNKWPSNFIYIPQYANKAEPYSSWTARYLAAMEGWTKDGSWDYDVAMVLMHTNSKQQHIQTVTGTLAMTANWPRAAAVYAFGYPLSLSNGELMSRCVSSSSTASVIKNFDGIKLPCGLTKGASGGPWIQNFDSNTLLGYQTSVNSFTNPNYPGYMFGPYFNTDVWNLYKKYENA